ncbi:MAG: ABC transporter ATP-binding protein [Anaerolineales bacterium]|nr:ABC transporter ATP-binding protein [Anaerolineales bacterium]
MNSWINEIDTAAPLAGMPNLEPVLVIQDLSAVFPSGDGGLQALDRLSFCVYPQEFVCVLGPSGSGKSTLLRILAGLLPPTQGAVTYRGEALTTPRREIGFVFQKLSLMPWRSVLQNILLPLQLQHAPDYVAEPRARELVELVGLQGFEDALPRDLSGGMAQRVAIARALIHDPDVLLLDEPFGALDALTRERMGEELLRIWQARRKTVVMVTHSISEALFLADRVLVLSPRPGRLRLDLPVALSRPRSEAMRFTRQFGELSRRVREAIT